MMKVIIFRTEEKTDVVHYSEMSELKNKFQEYRTIVGKGVSFGNALTLGEFCVFDDNVDIGTGCRLGSFVACREGAWIGDGCMLFDKVKVGKSSIVAEGSTLEVGARLADGSKTEAGAVVPRGRIV